MLLFLVPFRVGFDTFLCLIGFNHFDLFSFKFFKSLCVKSTFILYKCHENLILQDLLMILLCLIQGPLASSLSKIQIKGRPIY